MKAKSPQKRRRGRPNRAEASAKALRDVDLDLVDPRSVLLAIAGDTSAPATARVAAARVLLGQPDQPPADAGGADTVTALAIKLLQGGGRR